MMNLFNELTVGAKVYFAIIIVISLIFFGFSLANLIKIIRKIKSDTFSFDDVRNQELTNFMFVGLCLALVFAHGLAVRLQPKFDVFSLIFFAICYIPLLGAYVLTSSYDHEIDEPMHGKFDKTSFIALSIVGILGLIVVVAFMIYRISMM